MKYVLLLLAIAFIFLAGFAIYETRQKKEPHPSGPPPDPQSCSDCTILHMPKKGCPPGFNPVIDFFTEADGSHQDACIREGIPADRGVIDVLKPGESFGLLFEIERDEERPRERT
jgi:hypothetical protein